MLPRSHPAFDTITAHAKVKGNDRSEGKEPDLVPVYE